MEKLCVSQAQRDGKVFDIISILKKHDIKYVPIGEELCFQCPVCKREDHFYYNKKKNLCLCQRCKCEFNAVGFLLTIGYTKEDAVRSVHGQLDISKSSIKGKIDELLSISNSYEDIEMNSVYFKNPIPKGCVKISNKRYPVALSERGIPIHIINSLDVQYCNSVGIYSNRLIFPVTTLKSKTFVAPTAFTKKNYENIKKKQKERGINFRKSLFPKGSFMSEMLYLYNSLRYKAKKIFVVEGIWDVLKLMSYRLDATCTFGDKVSRKQALLLSETDAEEIWLMLDGSVPEKRLIKYYDLLNMICYDKKIFLCRLPYENDPDDVSEKDFITTIREAKKRSSPIWIPQR